MGGINRGEQLDSLYSPSTIRIKKIMDRPRRIVRSPSLKRKSRPVPLTERVCLEKVLGLNVPNNAAIAVSSATGIVAYPSGCVIVLLNIKKNRQTHIFNTSKKTITAIAFSGDGKYLVTGECGHQPAVRVWDIEEKTQASEFHGHKFGIHCVAFSPNMRYIVSIGTQHDMMVNVWDWKAGCKFASNKVSSKVSNLAFSEDGSHFVTVGLRHVKFWYLEATKSRIKETVPLHGRASILGDQRNNYFTDVVCGIGANADKTYSITQSGLLCEFNSKRLLTKWVKLRTKVASALSLSETELFVGCADGIVRVFDASSFKFIATLPRPHYIGIDVAAGLDSSHMATYPADAKYPDTLAVVFDRKLRKICTVYNDHSLYIWDVRDVKKVGKIWSYLYHSHCVWGLEMYPNLPESECPALPAGSFITCSSDDTIRVWNLDPSMASNTTWKRNIYSHELLKIIYTDPDYNFICDVDYNPAGGTDKTDTSYVGKNGVRSIRVSPDGQHLASGDRVGNVRVYDLRYMEEVALVEAHEGEVLALEYYQSKTDASMNLLASASRDRLIHVFDANNDYTLLHTLDDHSSSITAIKFVELGDKLQLISCGADKSLLFRNAVKNPDLQFTLHRHLVGKTTLYDMDVDSSHKFLATACQDRNVRIYNILTGKQRKCYKGSLGDDGTLIKVQLDPSGTLMAASCSDKNLCVIDFYSGDCLSTMYGHSEIAPGIQFMLDMKHLISVSGDGFVWRLHPEFTHQMVQRMRDKAEEKLEISDVPNTNGDGDMDNDGRATYSTMPSLAARQDAASQSFEDDVDAISRPLLASDTPDDKYTFSVVQLPAWAKKQFVNDHGSPGKRRASAPTLVGEMYQPRHKVLHEEADLNSPLTNPSAPRGRWAQRLDEESLVLKGEGDSQIPLSFMNSLDRRRFTVEPDALESELQELRRQTLIIEKGSKLVQKDIPIVMLQDIPIVMLDDDAADDDEDDEFCQLNTSRQHREEEDTYSSVDTLTGRSDNRYSPRKNRFLSAEESEKREEGLDEDEDNAEEQVIYYPAVQDDVEDEDTEDTNRKDSSSTFSDSGSKDRSSGNGGLVDDTISDEELGEELGSAPSTPLEPDTTFIIDPAAKEEFFRKTFENIGASPTFSDVSMSSSETANPTALDQSPSHRLSLSSRFLSRAQQSHLRTTPSSGMQKLLQGCRKLFSRGKHIAAQAQSVTQSQELENTIPERTDPPSPPTKLPASESQRDSTEGREGRVDYSRTTGSLRRKKTTTEDSSKRSRKRNSAPPQPSMRKSFSTTDLSQAQSGRNSTGRTATRGPVNKSRPQSITRDRSSSSPTRGRAGPERHQSSTEASRRRSATQAQGGKNLQRAASAANLESGKEDSNGNREQSNSKELRKSVSTATSSSPKSSPRRQKSLRQSAPLENFASQPNLDSVSDVEPLSPRLSRSSSIDSEFARNMKKERKGSLDDKKEDRLIMPPPATTVVAKNKSDSFMRFAGKSLKSSSSSKSKQQLLTKNTTPNTSSESVKLETSDTECEKRVTFPDEDALETGVPTCPSPETYTSPARMTTERAVDDLSPSFNDFPVKDSNSPDAITTIAGDILRWHSSTVSPRGSPAPQGSPSEARNSPRGRMETRAQSPLSTISSDLTPLIAASSHPVRPSHLTNGQHGTNASPMKSPDRSRLSLPLKRCDNSPGTEHTDPAVAQAMEEDCTQAICEMKRAVRHASDVYHKVHSSGVVRNGERQHLMAILTEAFREVRSDLSPVLANDRAHTTAQTDLDLDNLDPELLHRLEPILDHYSSELSDRVLAIVEERLEEKNKPSPETDI